MSSSQRNKTSKATSNSVLLYATQHRLTEVSQKLLVLRDAVHLLEYELSDLRRNLPTTVTQLQRPRSVALSKPVPQGQKRQPCFVPAIKRNSSSDPASKKLRDKSVIFPRAIKKPKENSGILKVTPKKRHPASLQKQQRLALKFLNVVPTLPKTRTSIKPQKPKLSLT